MYNCIYIANMIKRQISDRILECAKGFPAVAILGSRQSGKTTLAKSLFKKHRYVSFENPDIRKWANADPRDFLEKHNTRIIFDEIQKCPHIFSYLQQIIDERNKSGDFIFTGSQNYLLMESITQSLAGRAGINYLLPFSTREIRRSRKFGLTLEDYIITGGYPRIYDKKIKPADFYQSYLNTYLQRDIRLIKNITNYDNFLKFLGLIAGRSGQVLNLQALSEDSGIASNTIKEWLNILETSFIVFRLGTYHRNYNKRLIKSPKVFFHDTGLLCHLMNIRDAGQYSAHYYKGNIFENFIISEIVKYNYNNGTNYPLYFWRDNHRKEIDLIIDKGLGPVAVEIKSAKTFNTEFSNGLKYWKKISNVSDKNLYLIYAGDLEMKRAGINVLNWRKSETPIL